MTFYPAQNSRVHLFEHQLSIEESKWQPTVRDRLLFICIVILTVMEAIDATVLIAVLPVSSLNFLYISEVQNIADHTTPVSRQYF